MNARLTSFPPREQKAASWSILVFGAGAIGTYVGGSLAMQGAKVVFLVRPQVLATLVSSGMHMKLDLEEHHLEAPLVVTSLPEALNLGDYQVILIAVKSYDSRQVASQLANYASGLPPVFCLQNGVDNETILAESMGAEKVIAGTITSSVSRGGTGYITLERKRGIGVAAGHPLSPALVELFNTCGLNGKLYPSASAMKWSKLLTNLMANASSAILDMTPRQIYSHPGLYRMEMLQLREALAVMAAQHIQVVNLPGAPVKLLATTIRGVPALFSRPLLQQLIGGGRGGKMPSFHIDLHGGHQQSEVEYLNGAVARHGESRVVATPVNHVLTNTLLALVQRKIPMNSYSHQPDKLLALVEQASSATTN